MNAYKTILEAVKKNLEHWIDDVADERGSFVQGDAYWAVLDLIETLEEDIINKGKESE